jgi:hypothetical protein
MNRDQKDRSVLRVLITAIGLRKTDGRHGAMCRHSRIGPLHYLEYDSGDILQGFDFSLLAHTSGGAAI